MSANLSPLLLEAKAVAKHFGGVKALQDVSLSIRRGEIYGLIGPNGAGKTTFFNCMTGLYVPDGGGFVFDGTPLVADAPDKAAGRGIARTFQNIRHSVHIISLFHCCASFVGSLNQLISQFFCHSLAFF